MNIIFNMNDRAAVRLTEAGCAQYRKYCRRLKVIPPRMRPGFVLDEPLWSLFALFGEALHMGGEIMFVGNQIAIQEDKLPALVANLKKASGGAP